jgi:hypothetical protein
VPNPANDFNPKLLIGWPTIFSRRAGVTPKYIHRAAGVHVYKSNRDVNAGARKLLSKENMPVVKKAILSFLSESS